MDPRQRILQVLQGRPGRENAVTAKRLAVMVGISERDVRQTIQELRRQGYPVASGVHKPYGFYWPQSAEEAQECQRHLYSRIRELWATAKALEKAFGSHLPGRQMVLDIFNEHA